MAQPTRKPLITEPGKYIPPRVINIQLRSVSGPLWRRLKVESAKRDLTLAVLADQAVATWLDLNEGLADESIADEVPHDSPRPARLVLRVHRGRTRPRLGTPR